MKMRVFGSNACDACSELKNTLQANRVSFQFLDGFADENQDLCDEQGVWDFPHVQILSDKGTVLKEFDAETNPSYIVNVWLDLMNLESKPKNGRST